MKKEGDNYLKFSKEQIDRQALVDNSIYALCRDLRPPCVESEELDWDIGVIGVIRDYIENYIIIGTYHGPVPMPEGRIETIRQEFYAAIETGDEDDEDDEDANDWGKCYECGHKFVMDERVYTLIQDYCGTCWNKERRS